MEVILRESVLHLGAAGDVVKVKDGYARNYLLPKGLAYPATDEARRRLHVPVTRTSHQLWLASSRDRSPLLPQS